MAELLDWYGILNKHSTLHRKLAGAGLAGTNTSAVLNSASSEVIAAKGM